MTSKERGVVDELLTEFVKDGELINKYKLRFLDASQEYSPPNPVIETDYDFNVLRSYKSLAHYVHFNGVGEFKSESSLIDAVRNKRAVLKDTVLHYKKNFDNGEYSMDKRLRVNNVDFIDYDDLSVMDRKSGAIIDKSDLDKLKGYSVFIMPNHKCGSYVKVRDLVNNTGVQSIHRFLLDMGKIRKGGLVVDHINGNTLDNRRCNLRICYQRHNTLNRSKNKPRKYTKTSKYKGVSKSSKDSYTVQTSVLKQEFRKKGYSEDKAARVYDVIQIALAGEYANTNFPIESYPKKLISKFRGIYLQGYKSVYDDI